MINHAKVAQILQNVLIVIFKIFVHCVKMVIM